MVFSVGPMRWLEELAAGYRHLVSALVSAEAAGVYKPHPDLYRHLLRVTEAEPAQVHLVSGNPFDLIGGAAVGLGTVWCRRDPAAGFDPWGPRPHHTVGSLAELVQLQGVTVRPEAELIPAPSWNHSWRVIIDNQVKVMQKLSESSLEAYDLAVDPGEQHNLPATDARVQALLAKIKGGS